MEQASGRDDLLLSVNRVPLHHPSWRIDGDPSVVPAERDIDRCTAQCWGAEPLEGSYILAQSTSPLDP